MCTFHVENDFINKVLFFHLYYMWKIQRFRYMLNVHIVSNFISESVLEYDMLLSANNEWLGQEWEEKSQCQLFLQTLQFTNTLLWILLDQAIILLRRCTHPSNENCSTVKSIWMFLNYNGKNSSVVIWLLLFEEAS